MRHAIISEDLKKITNAPLPWDYFANKKILITGASGFLAAYMVETLLFLNERKNLNCQVLALVRNEQKAKERFHYYLNNENLKFIIQDVITPIILSEKLDCIIHAASYASPKYYGSDPVGTLSANVLGTHYLLELAKQHEVSNFLFVSSGEVYGEINPAQIPTPENAYGYIDPTEVRSCYSESKRMGETMCVAWHHQFGIPARIVRPFHTFGPGMKLDDGRVYADFVANIIDNKDIEMHSDGQAVRAFCYLSDAIIGFFTVLLKGSAGQAYNIGNPKNAISVLQLANLLIELFAEKNLKVITKAMPAKPGYLKSTITQNCPDISKATQLAWEPTITVAEGFSRTVRSFQ